VTNISSLILVSALLSGCAAVPLPISLTLWALDGTSYVITDRTLLDHAISAVADKDCRIFRGLQQKQFCIDLPENTPD
jgi:hypothetical protein